MAADAQVRTDRQVMFSRYQFSQWVSLQEPYLYFFAQALCVSWSASFFSPWLVGLIHTEAGRT